MAYVTPIGADPEQVEYRLAGGHGCSLAEADDRQFSYHADGRERPLTWIGQGLPEVGIEPGTELSEDQFDKARALMRGCDPRTGERLVTPKEAVYDDAKVPLAPLVAVIEAKAAQQGMTVSAIFRNQKLAKEFKRSQRSVNRLGSAAIFRADEAGAMADSAGIPIEQVWSVEEYETAVANLTETRTIVNGDGTLQQQTVNRRRIVGNLGYDITLTMPKSHSLLLAFGDDDTAAAVENIYLHKSVETFEWLEEQTAYGMRGKHGDGKTADVVKGSGFLGWMMLHRSARPMNGREVGDPHWHPHITIANMTRGEDGAWSTVAAGGRDLMRHAPAADHILKALVRRELIDAYGVKFARSERTNAWEVEAIPDETLRAFSKRGVSIEAMLRDLGFDPQTASRRAEDIAAAHTRSGKTDTTSAPDATVRQLWQDEAAGLGIDPDQLAADAMPGAGTNVIDGSPEAKGRLLADVVAQLTDPDSGLTSKMRRFTRADALAAVADAMPDGAADLQEIEKLTDRVLEHRGFHNLEPAEDGKPAAELDARRQSNNGKRNQLAADHMRNAGKYTTTDLIEAERTILETAGGSVRGLRFAAVDGETADLARSVVEAAQGFELSKEQARIMRGLVTSDRPLDALIGPPGTGKTTLMRAARTAWEAQEYTVAGTATAAVAAQNLQIESGIPSKTVAQWLYSIEQAREARLWVGNGYRCPPELAGKGDEPKIADEPADARQRREIERQLRKGGLSGVDVLVMDEANLTDDRDRAKLYIEARRTGTKIVEAGDPKQLRGVGGGSSFGCVHEIVGGWALTENRRQQDQDERTAIAAWRSGKYADALENWEKRGRFVATETGDEAFTAMVAEWMRQRKGAPDPHSEIRGVVMLASTNEAVDRLNEAAQSVRSVSGELGAERVYELRAGRSVHLAENDHVLIRLNSRRQRMHEGPDVLNGYRGVITAIEEDGSVKVEWEQDADDGRIGKEATLSPEFIAKGGLSLGYAMTGHKAEGLTVKADWSQPDGAHQGGSVLVYGPGMDEPGQHVATTRHKDKMFYFTARELVESKAAQWEHGTAKTEPERAGRTVEAVAAEAARTSTNANDTPVHKDLGRQPEKGARKQAESDADKWEALKRGRGRPPRRGKDEQVREARERERQQRLDRKQQQPTPQPRL